MTHQSDTEAMELAARKYFGYDSFYHHGSFTFEAGWRAARARDQQTIEELQADLARMTKWNDENAGLCQRQIGKVDMLKGKLEWIAECMRRLRGNEHMNEAYIVLFHEALKVETVSNEALSKLKETVG